MSRYERVPAEKARKDFSRLIDEAGLAHKTRIITKNGKDRAAIISVDDLKLYQRLQEYVDGIKALEAQREMEGQEWVSFERVLEEYGLSEDEL